MRTATLYRSVKFTALLGVAMMLLGIIAPAMAMTKVVEGVGLKEPLEIELDFSESDYLLVTASQSDADYLLSLVDRVSNEKLLQLSVEYGVDLDEVLLVSRDECGQCNVILEGFAKIDMGSPYRLLIRPLIEPQQSTLSALRVLNEASVLIFEAGEVKTKDATRRKLEEVVSLLNSSASKQSEHENIDWRHHKLILLADTQRRLEQFEAQQQTLNRVIAETEVISSTYRSNALLEIAKSTEDVKRKLEVYDQLIRNAEISNSERFIALGSVGRAVTLIREAQYEEAIKLLKYASKLFAKHNNFRELLIVLHNLSWANQRAGNLPESLRYASQQQLLSEKRRDQENTVWSLYNFAMTYGQMGDAKVADDFLDRALNLLSNEQADVSFDTEEISAYLMLEKTQRALQFGAYELAGDYAVRAKKQFEAVGNQSQIENVKFVQGEISMALADYPSARKIFAESIRYNNDNNRVLLSGSFSLRLAELEIVEGNYIQAAGHQAEALRILSKTEDYKGLAKAFSQTVELLYRLGAPSDAEKLADRVGAFVELHSLEQEKAKFAYRRALSVSELGSFQDSLSHLEVAMSIIENTLPKVRRRDLRQSYLGLQKSVFELSIEIALKMDSDNIMQALMLAEKFRARTLKESINSIDADSGIDSESVAERAELLKKIQTKAVAWHAHNIEKDNASLILEETRALSLALQKLETKIETSRQKQLSSLNKTRVEGVPAAQANELIAYYFTGERQSWLWVLTANKQNVYPLPRAKKIEPLIERFLDQVVKAPSSRLEANAWSQISAVTELSDVLLSPLKEILSPNINLITIVADGPLHAVPFAPLQLPDSEEPLIVNYSIVQAPSLLAKDSLRKRASKRHAAAELKALIVADPLSSEKSNLSLERLNHSVEEAQYIESQLSNSATTLMSEKALKVEFLKQLSGSYSILHFATHGLLNSKEPALSGLVFSESEDSDSLWLAPEISRANITANLVVLSACESSIGKNVSGEGLFSLGRAFIEAGANQVVGTLWKVEDQATSKLMEQFYSKLVNENLTVAQSLQQAQKVIYLDKENDWSDPYYWAGFQLQGGGVNQIYASSH